MGEGNKVRQTCHRAIFIHDFADHASRIQPGHTGYIDGCLCVPGPHHCATILGDQRENVAGRNDIVMISCRVDGDSNGARAIMGGNARRHAFFCLYGNGERSLHAFTIVARHHVEMKCVRTLLRHGEADQAAPETRHEIDLLGRGKSGRHNQVAFIFAIFGIDENVHLAVAGILDDLVDRGYRVMELI